jgi:23S rRNA (uracil1939-C5)-methyltransferase
MDVPFAPPGGHVLVQPTGKRKGRWSGRRTELVEKPAAYAVPRCPQFGTCGGCALQELDGAAQADARARYARAEIAAGLGLPTEDLASRVRIHDHRRSPSDYGYRNKVELTFGVRRYLSDADHAAGLPVTGRFLGFHAPGRFDRVVDAPTCDLVPDALNAVLAVTRRLLLGDDGPSIYDVRTHQGFLRHLLLRRGARTGEVLARLYTATPACDTDRDAANAWLDAVFGAALPDGRVVGASWAVSDAVADVAQGAVQASRGADRLDERLGDAVFSLSATSFFQTNTESAEVLYDAVGEALGDASGLLVDLYCGTGAIGLYLASRFDRVWASRSTPPP